MSDTQRPRRGYPSDPSGGKIVQPARHPQPPPPLIIKAVSEDTGDPPGYTQVKNSTTISPEVPVFSGEVYRYSPSGDGGVGDYLRKCWLRVINDPAGRAGVVPAVQYLALDQLHFGQLLGRYSSDAPALERRPLYAIEVKRTQYAVVTPSWTANQAGSSTAAIVVPVKLLSCLSYPTGFGDEFWVQIPPDGNRDSDLYPGSVVEIELVDEAGPPAANPTATYWNVVSANAMGDKAGTVKMWSGAKETIPQGWAEYTSMRGCHPVGVGDPSDPLYSVDEGTLNAHGGHRWHGKTEELVVGGNDHPGHVLSKCAAAGSDVYAGDAMYLTHTGPFNNYADTDNRSFFATIYFIVRVLSIGS